jgi:hypothetical protein
MAVKWNKDYSAGCWWGTQAERIALTGMHIGDKFTESDTNRKYLYTGTAWMSDESISSIRSNLVTSELVAEIQTPFAKNTLADVEKIAIQILAPNPAVTQYKIAMKNPSIDTAVTVRLFNRRVFNEIGLSIVTGSDGTHIQLSGDANPTDDYYNGAVITITGGTGVGQSRTILDYVGATQIAQVAVWTTATDETSTYSIAMTTNSLVYSGSFPKASLTAPIALATDSAYISGLFDNGCNVYFVISNDDAIPDADASRFTTIFQLISA